MNNDATETAAADWEQRAFDRVRDFMTQLHAGFRERDLGRKLVALDGLARQARSWYELLEGKENQ